MYEDTVYGGQYFVTGKNKTHVKLSGYDEFYRHVTGAVPKEVFYQTFRKIEGTYETV